jgi:hypothetical protein
MLYKTHRRTSDILAMVLSEVLRCVLYNIVCPCWFWLWYCLTFFDVFHITLFVLTMLFKTHRRTSDNTMVKPNKHKQCNTKHMEERQTIPWPKPTRTNNVMQNRSKNAMVLSDFLRCVSYNIVWPCWFWPRYCRTFFDVFCITLSNNVIQNTSKNVRQYHGQTQQTQTM